MNDLEHGLFDFASKLGFFGGLFVRKHTDRLYFFEEYSFFRRVKPEFDNPKYPLNKILTFNAELIIDEKGRVIKSRHSPLQFGQYASIKDVGFNSDLIYKTAGKERLYGINFR